MIPEDLEKRIREGRLNRRDFFKILGILGAGVALDCCSSSSDSDNDVKKEVKILPTFNADYSLEGGNASGTVKYVGNDMDVTVNLGEQADLGSAPEGETKDITVYIKGDDALERVFKDVAMSGTSVYNTNILKKNGFNLDDFISKFLMGNTNDRWNQHSVVVYFNPDNREGGTGERLPQEWVKATKDAIDKIKDNSAGFIQSVEYYEQGNKKREDSPANGEGWVFYAPDTSGVANITYPNFDGPVHAFKLLFNPKKALVVAVENEAIDAFFGDNQNHFPDQYKWKWIKFSFMRPTYSYRIYLDREEQVGFDGSVMLGTSRFVEVKYETVVDPYANLPSIMRNPDDKIKEKRVIRDLPSDYEKRRMSGDKKDIK